MLSFLFMTLVVMAILAVLGFLRSGVANRPNTMLINLGDKARHWLAEDTLVARVSVLFLPLLALYNLLAWALFGLQFIIELLLLVVKGLAWLLIWLRDEVLHPTVFAFLKLLWHYLVVSSWRLFEFGFSPVRSSVRTANLVDAGKKLIILFLILGGLFAAVLLISSIYVSIPAVVLAFFLSQNTQFRILQSLEPARFPEPNLQTARRLTGLWLVLSIIGGGLIALVLMFNSTEIAKGIGVTATQAGVVLAVLAGSAFMSASTCLPAHLEETGGDGNLLTYLKALLWRLPKLVYGQVFQIPALILLSIIPLVFGATMNFAIQYTTGRDVLRWADEITGIQSIPPGINADLKAIEQQEQDSIKLEGEKAKALREHDLKIDEAKKRLDHNQRLLSNIKSREIHTIVEGPVTGEEQFFSIPPVPSSTAYDWQIKESDGDRVAEYTVSASDGRSSVIEHRWAKEGEYIVSVTPRNSCGKGEGITRQVTVSRAAMPYFKIPNPTGKTVVCSGEEVNYTTKGGSGHYEWQIPSDASILSDPNQNKILVKFGNQSGTIRVRASDAEGRYSLWTGIDVKVIPTPGNNESQGRYVEDEGEDKKARTRSFVFRTREEGKEAVSQLQAKLEELKAARKATEKEFAEKIHRTQVQIKALYRDIRMMLFRLFGNLLALAGLALLAGVVFAAPMLYALQFHFNLFGFAQKGSHYWEELLDGIRHRNPRQPLLGIFTLLVLGGLYFGFLKDLQWPSSVTQESGEVVSDEQPVE